MKDFMNNSQHSHLLILENWIVCSWMTDSLLNESDFIHYSKWIIHELNKDAIYWPYMTLPITLNKLLIFPRINFMQLPKYNQPHAPWKTLTSMWTLSNLINFSWAKCTNHPCVVGHMSMLPLRWKTINIPSWLSLLPISV